MNPNENNASALDEATTEEVAQCREAYDTIRSNLGQVIVGMEPMIEQLMIAMMCRGHCILQGMPGLAKTLLVSSLARLVDMSFSRIQFTPDLMPSDITGGEVLEEDRTTGKRAFRFIKGPNLVLDQRQSQRVRHHLDECGEVFTFGLASANCSLLGPRRLQTRRRVQKYRTSGTRPTKVSGLAMVLDGHVCCDRPGNVLGWLRGVATLWTFSREGTGAQDRTDIAPASAARHTTSDS